MDGDSWYVCYPRWNKQGAPPPSLNWFAKQLLALSLRKASHLTMMAGDSRCIVYRQIEEWSQTVASHYWI